MSIATNLQKLETDITNAYDAVQTKGGTIPTDKNTNNLATAISSISGGGPTLITKNITANGTYNASSDNADGYSQVTVAVPTGSTNSKCFKFTLTSTLPASAWYYANNADTDIASHVNDNTFVVTVMNTTDYSEKSYRVISVTATNHDTNSFNTNYSFGMVLRTSTSGVTSYSAVNKAVNNTTPASGGCQICATSDGKIGLWGNASYPWVAGEYVVIVGW